MISHWLLGVYLTTRKKLLFYGKRKIFLALSVCGKNIHLLLYVFLLQEDESFFITISDLFNKLSKNWIWNNCKILCLWRKAVKFVKFASERPRRYIEFVLLGQKWEGCFKNLTFYMWKRNFVWLLSDAHAHLAQFFVAWPQNGSRICGVFHILWTCIRDNINIFFVRYPFSL